MVFARSTSFRASFVSQAARSARNSFRSAGQPQRWQRIGQNVSRRGYSSSHGGQSKNKLKSDLPWALASVAVTIPGTYYLLQPSESGHHGHDEHHDEDHEEKHEEAPAEESKEEPKEEPEEEPKEEPKAESKEEPKDDKPQPPQETKQSEKPKEAPKEGDATKSEDPGLKKNTEQSPGVTVGGGDANDTATSSKPLVENQTSAKQEGVANTDTKHSTDPSSQHSKKPEGTVDSAKDKGTVDPEKPAA